MSDNYKDGLMKLIYKTSSGFNKNANLKTEFAEMNKEKIFTPVTSELIYFSYSSEESAWFWAYDYSTKINDQTINKIWHKSKSLEDMNFYEGAIIMFEGKLNLGLESDSFTEKEKEVINSATECEDCGNGWLNNLCDEKECSAISIKINVECVYSENWLGIGSCKTSDVGDENSIIVGDAIFNYDDKRKIWTINYKGIANKNKPIDEFIKQERNGDIISVDKEIVEKAKEIAKEHNVGVEKIYDLKSAIEKVKTLNGNYGSDEENVQFIYDLYISGIITYEEYGEIAGGGWFNSEEDMKWVKELLLKKQAKQRLSS